MIAMSGGVDSSLAAKLILDAGIDCIGCTMQLIGSDASGIEDARAVAGSLGIPFYVFDLQKEFRDTVIDNFIRSYEAGLTPNPCIVCNKYMKFGLLFEKARQLGCDYVATGHYAKIEEGMLKKAEDKSKDQSYVLYQMTKEQLQHVLLPLGSLSKDEVRQRAIDYGFTNALRPDSQDICFIPDGDYASFLIKNTGKEYPEGDFVDEDGNVLGRHKGIVHYTIGQRKGLGIALGVPMFVKKIDAAKNQVVLACNNALFAKELNCTCFNWINGTPSGPARCSARIRYKHQEQPCTITPLEDGGAHVVFDEPQRAITPGQSLVAYDGDIVLGGGTIVPDQRVCNIVKGINSKENTYET